MKTLFDKEYMEVSDVAEVLGLSVITIYGYIRQGKLKPVRKLGRNHIFDPAHVKAFTEGK